MASSILKETPALKREESSTYASASSSPYETPRTQQDKNPLDTIESSRNANNNSASSSDTDTDTELESEVEQTKDESLEEHGAKDSSEHLPDDNSTEKAEDNHTEKADDNGSEKNEIDSSEPSESTIIDKMADTEQIHLAHGEQDDTQQSLKDTGDSTGAEFEKKVAEERKGAGEGEEATEEEMNKVESRLREIIDNALQTIKPFLQHMVEECAAAEEKHRKSQDFDEKQFVESMKKLIKQSSEILEGALAKVQAVDPDKKVQRRANRNAEDNKASPNQRFIADGLKKLSEEVQKTIDECKEKIKDMPHAKSELDGMFGMLTRPLFQILSAVGLLVYGVLNLLGEILDTLGLGGLFRGLMDGLGINKLLNALGWKLEIVKTDKK